MDWLKMQAWWAARQGLDGSLEGKSSAQVLSRAGWARSVGGSNPYLTLFSRAGVSAKQAEKDLAANKICELPSARGCTYYLPASDYAVGLRIGQGFSEAAAMRTARNYLGVTDKEIERLCARVLDVLTESPMEPKDIREAVGSAVRNLGEEGKKRGQTTTLGLALGNLQSLGEIRRVPSKGKLDQQHFGYIRWMDNPLSKSKLTRDEAFELIAKKYFDWIGCATIAHFRWFTGLGVGDAKKALSSLKLQTLEDDWLATPEALDHYKSFKRPKDPQVFLISSIDSLLLLRRDVMSFVAPHEEGQQMATTKGLRLVRGLQDLENNAIIDRGTLVGVWEYDPGSEEIVHILFAKSKPLNPFLDSKIQSMERYVTQEIGDVRSFSLDSPKSRAPKLAALRKLSGI